MDENFWMSSTKVDLLSKISSQRGPGTNAHVVYIARRRGGDRRAVFTVRMIACAAAIVRGGGEQMRDRARRIRVVGRRHLQRCEDVQGAVRFSARKQCIGEAE